MPIMFYAININSFFFSSHNYLFNYLCIATTANSLQPGICEYIQLLYAAHTYTVPGLKALCETNLSRRITLENSADILKASLETNSCLLQEDVDYFISNAMRPAVDSNKNEERKEVSESTIDSVPPSEVGKIPICKHVRFVSPSSALENNGIKVNVDPENVDINLMHEVEELGKPAVYNVDSENKGQS